MRRPKYFSFLLLPFHLGALLLLSRSRFLMLFAVCLFFPLKSLEEILLALKYNFLKTIFALKQFILRTFELKAKS